MFVHDLAEGLVQMWKVSWTCIYILVHDHILTKVLDQRSGDWDIQKGPHSDAHICTQLWKGGRDNMQCWVDMHTSKQGMEPDEG